MRGSTCAQTDGRSLWTRRSNERTEDKSDKERKYILLNYVEERGIVILVITGWAFSTFRGISRKTGPRGCWRFFPAPKNDDKSV